MGIKDWFRKDDTVIDLRDMQERGILRKREDGLESQESVVDLTKNKADSTDSSSAFGFLGALAGASSAASSLRSSEEVSTGESIAFTSDRRTKLRGILRDMKEKMDSTSHRIYKLSERIDLLEHKIERLERRSGF